MIDVLLLNAIAYILLFLYSFYRYRSVNIYNSVILAYTIISILGYITTKMGIQLVGSVNFGLSASPIPYICQFIAVLLIVSPLKKISPESVDFKIFRIESLRLFLKFSMFVLLVVIFVKLYEFFLVLQQGLAEAYVAIHEEGGKLIEFSNPILAFLSTKGMTYVDAIFPLLVYYYFSKLREGKGKTVSSYFYLGICFTPEVLNSLVTGSKGMLFFNAFDMIFFYLYFKRSISEGARKLLIFCGFFVAAVLIFYAFAIQNSRNDYDKSTKMASEVMMRYLGESMPNLGDLYHDTREHPYGKRLFPTFTGGKTFTNAEERARYWEMKTNARVLNFMTIWGDSYIEFGIIGSFVFLFVVVFLYKRYVFRYGGKFYIFPLVYYYYHKVCIYGIFGVAFVDIRSLQVTLYAILLCIFLYIITTNSELKKNKIWKNV